MSDVAAVLSANRAFYRAFAARDLEAMGALWASEAPVACVHPGWDALRDRKAIMTSWRNILGNPGSPAVLCANETAHVLGDVAYVLRPGWMGSAAGATHGSPHADDTHVPLLLWGPPWVKPGRVDTRVEVVDLAPTLAQLLRLPPPPASEGRVLPLP